MPMPIPTRVTIEDVEGSILNETYTVLPNGRTTVCQLTLVDNGNSGFTVEGQSACVSLENYDRKMGESLAKQDALSKVWMLLGYRVALQLEKQHRIANESWEDQLKREYAELSLRIESLTLWLDTPSYNLLPIDEQEDQKEQLVMMRQYGEILDRRMARLVTRSP